MKFRMTRVGGACYLMAAGLPCMACAHVTGSSDPEAEYLSCDTDEHGNGECRWPGVGPAVLDLRMRGENIRGFRGGLVCSETSDGLRCFLLERPVRTSTFKLSLPKGERYFWPDGVCVGIDTGGLYCRWFNPMNYPGSMALSSQEVSLSGVSEFDYTLVSNGACFCAETKAFCLLSSPDEGEPVSLGAGRSFIHPPYLVQVDVDEPTTCETLGSGDLYPAIPSS